MTTTEQPSPPPHLDERENQTTEGLGEVVSEATRSLKETVEEVVDDDDDDSSSDTSASDSDSESDVEEASRTKKRKRGDDDDKEEDDSDGGDIKKEKKAGGQEDGGPSKQRGMAPKFTKGLLKRMARVNRILIGLAFLASLLYSFGHLLTFKRVVQALTLLSVLRGLILKLPHRTALPLVGSALTMGGMQQHFSFEYLNSRFLRDIQELQTCLRSATAAEVARVLAASGAAPGPITSLLASTLMKATTNNTEGIRFGSPSASPSSRNTSSSSTNTPRQRPRVFVFDLKGDVRLTDAPFLTRMVTFLLSVASPEDEVIYLLESPGGAVMDYGLMASQLHRIRQAGIKLTACVDRMAASGGYMLACVASKVVAAPFASIGSIGVKVQTYNVERLAKNWGVNIQSYSAGKYKLLGARLSTTWWERAKIQQSLNAVLNEFKRHVSTYRPDVDVDKVATGEVWLGLEAKEKKLVDEVMTSEEYIHSLMAERDVIMVKQHDGGGRLLSRLSSPVFPGRRVKLLFQAALYALSQRWDMLDGSGSSSSFLLRSGEDPDQILAHDEDPLINLAPRSYQPVKMDSTTTQEKENEACVDDVDSGGDPTLPAARFAAMLGYEGSWSG